MKTLKLIGMFPLLIAASTFAQDDNRAVPRGSSGSSSDAGSRHTGGSSGSSSSSSSSADSGRGGSSASSGGSQNSPSSDAAGRRPRPGTGSGTRDRYGNDRDQYRGSPYSNYYYDPYSYSWGNPRSRYGYGYGYYDYGFGYGDYYGYYPPAQYRSYRYRSGNIAQVRTLVEPAKTRVYVDGYYAGIADDFDGLLQRLNVSPGRHEITLRLEGYRSHTFSIYGNRDQTLKLRFDMVKGTGETRDSVGEERAEPGDDRYGRESAPEREMEMHRDSARGETDRSREVDSDRPNRAPSREGARGGVLLDIEPPDASVYVDGEFHGKAAQLTRLQLSPGRHRIEVVRPGYKTQETEVLVESESESEAKRVSVKLERR